MWFYGKILLTALQGGDLQFLKPLLVVEVICWPISSIPRISGNSWLRTQTRSSPPEEHKSSPYSQSVSPQLLSSRGKIWGQHGTVKLQPLASSYMVRQIDMACRKTVEPNDCVRRGNKVSCVGQT